MEDTAVAEAVNLVSFVVTHITGDDGCFHITPKEDERGTLLTLAIDKKEAGRVIGKEGKTASAIRQVLRALAVKNNRTYFLKIDVWEGREEA